MPSASSAPAARPQSFALPLLLAATGGLLDAATYILRGHVFATALTGNVVLLGLSVLTRRASDILPHISPILGFFAGGLASGYTRTRLRHRAHAASLILEAAVLVAAGVLPPGFSNTVFSAIISFAGGLQVASFHRLGPWDYGSAFLTGDVRDTADALCAALTGRSPESRARARLHAGILALVCLCFFAGATIAAFAAGLLGPRTFWLPVPVLVAVLPATLHESARAAPPHQPATPAP